MSGKKLIGGVAHVQVTCTGCGARVWTQATLGGRRRPNRTFPVTRLGTDRVRRYVCNSCK